VQLRLLKKQTFTVAKMTFHEIMNDCELTRQASFGLKIDI
jgi:hypothetical protein